MRKRSSPVLPRYESLIVALFQNFTLALEAVADRETIQSCSKFAGFRLGEWIDQLSRKMSRRKASLSPQEYAETAMAVFAQFGGTISLRKRPTPDQISFQVTSCPHGGKVRKHPNWCFMTCGFLAGLASRNFPLESLEFKKRIATGDRWCHLVLQLPKPGAKVPDRVEITRRLKALEENPLNVVEREVLMLVSRGFSNREIAVHLGYKLGTVKFYVTRIMRKLEVTKRSEAASLALRKGWIE